MRRLKVLFLTALLVAACSTAVPTPSATAMPTSAPSAPSAPVRPTPTPVPPGSCPTGSPIDVGAFADADPACFGSAGIEIRGWLDELPGVGFEPPVIEPGWIYFPSTPWALWSQEVGRDLECLREGVPCNWYAFHIDPVSRLEIVRPARWLVVTGHFDDPVAPSCRWVYPEDWAEPIADDATAVATCRLSFVLDSFRDAP